MRRLAALILAVFSWRSVQAQTVIPRPVTSTGSAPTGGCQGLLGQSKKVTVGVDLGKTFCCVDQGGGVLQWQQCDVGGGAGNPAGSNTQLQFNQGGVFGGAVEATYNTSTQRTTVRSLVTEDHPSFDVLSFGALCDGTGDDQPEIQAAADAAAAVGGGTVLLPSSRVIGTNNQCMVGNEISLGTRVVLRGAAKGGGGLTTGGGARLRATGGFPWDGTKAMVKLAGGEGTRAENMSLACVDGANSIGVRSVDSEENGGLRDVNVTDCVKYGVWVDNSDGVSPFSRNHSYERVSILMSDSSDSTSTGFRVDGGTSGNIPAGRFLSDITIHGSTAGGAVGTCLSLDNVEGIAAKNLHVEFCTTGVKIGATGMVRGFDLSGLTAAGGSSITDLVQISSATSSTNINLSAIKCDSTVCTNLVNDQVGGKTIATSAQETLATYVLGDPDTVGINRTLGRVEGVLDSGAHGSPAVATRNNGDTTADRRSDIGFMHEGNVNARITSTRDSGTSSGGDLSLDTADTSGALTARVRVTKDGSVRIVSPSMLGVNVAPTVPFQVAGTTKLDVPTGCLQSTSGVISSTGVSCGSGTGDVSGPASAVDNQVVRFDGTTGKMIQAGTNAPSYDDAGAVTVWDQLAFGDTTEGYEIRWPTRDGPGTVDPPATRWSFDTNFSDVSVRTCNGGSRAGSPCGSDSHCPASACSASPNGTYRDHLMSWGYNQAQGARIDTTEHSFAQAMEATFWNGSTAELFEVNWDFTSSSGSSFRPFAFAINTGFDGASTGTAAWEFITHPGAATVRIDDDSTSGGGNGATVSINQGAESPFGTLQVYQIADDAAVPAQRSAIYGKFSERHTVTTVNPNTFLGLRFDADCSSTTASADCGSVTASELNASWTGAGNTKVLGNLHGLDVNVDLNPTGTGNTFTGAGGIDVDVNYSTTAANLDPADASVTGYGILVESPAGDLSATRYHYGEKIQDQRGMGSDGNAALLIDPQSGGSGEGNLHFGGGNFSNGHITFYDGWVHLWAEAGADPPILRINDGLANPPDSEPDGPSLVVAMSETANVRTEIRAGNVSMDPPNIDPTVANTGTATATVTGLAANDVCECVPRTDFHDDLGLKGCFGTANTLNLRLLNINTVTAIDAAAQTVDYSCVRK